jgi:chemotaxis protein MotB
MSEHAEEEDAGEGYFASISDLMVGILFVFLLMLTVFALSYADEDKDSVIRILEQRVAALEHRARSLEAERDQARAELQQRSEDLDTARREIARLVADVERLRAELERLIALTDPRERTLLLELLRDLSQVEVELGGLSDEEGRLQRLRRTLLASLRDRLRERGVEVEISAQNDVLRLPSEAVFQLGSANFTHDGRRQAAVLLEELTALLPCFARLPAGPPPSCAQPEPVFETVLIEGHTDTIPGDNWRLSANRAFAMHTLILGQPAGLRELRNSADQALIGIAGYGETRTLPGIPGNDGRNRRIELRFLLAAPNEANLVQLREGVARLRERLRILNGRRQ